MSKYNLADKMSGFTVFNKLARNNEYSLCVVSVYSFNRDRFFPSYYCSHQVSITVGFLLITDAGSLLALPLPRSGRLGRVQEGGEAVQVLSHLHTGLFSTLVAISMQVFLNVCSVHIMF